MLCRMFVALCAGGVLLAVCAVPAAAQSKEGAAEAAPKKEAAGPKGRLPHYFADVVSGEQREAIYKIQAKYQEELDELAAQIRDLVAKREMEVDAVLTPEQREKIGKARAAAVAKRKKEVEKLEVKPEAK